MRFSKILLTSFVFFVVFGLAPKGVWALNACTGAVSGVGVTLPKYYSGMTHTVEVDITNLNRSYKYYLKVKGSGSPLPLPFGVIIEAWYDDEAQTGSFFLQDGLVGNNGDGSWSISGNTLTFQITDSEALKSQLGSNSQTHDVILYQDDGITYDTRVCLVGTYTTTKSDLAGCGEFLVWQNRYSGPIDCSTASSRECNKCYQSSSGDCLEVGNNVYVQVSGLATSDGPYSGDARAVVYGVTGDKPATVANGVGTFVFDNLSSEKTYNITIYDKVAGPNAPFPNCSRDITISAACPQANQCSSNDSGLNPSDPAAATQFELCSQIKRDTPQYDECVSCATSAGAPGAEDEQAGIWTAIGCIKRDPTSIMQRFISLGLGIGGGVSLIMTLAGGFILTTSQGDPKRTGQAKEMITNAIIGLIFVIFSVTILQFIGYTVFRLPGFGE